MRTVERRIREPRNRHEGRLEDRYEGCSAKTTAAPGGSASCRTPAPRIEFGYLKKLPTDYTGERHIVTLGRLPDGNCQREERPGSAPANEDEDYSKTIIRINLVEAKHGQHGPAEAEA